MQTVGDLFCESLRPLRALRETPFFHAKLAKNAKKRQGILRRNTQSEHYQIMKQFPLGFRLFLNLQRLSCWMRNGFATGWRFELLFSCRVRRLTRVNVDKSI
jgi:hypothetical protein